MDKTSQLSQWMLGLRSDGPLTIRERTSRTQYRLLYLLELENNSWSISIHQARLSFSGTMGKPQKLDWLRVSQGNYPSASDQQDLAILQELSRTQGQLEAIELHLRQNILETLTRNHRLHFQTFHGQALEAGSEQPVSLIWTINNKGQQKAQWQTESTSQTLHVDPTLSHYVDIREGTLGKLTFATDTRHLKLPVDEWLDPEQTNELVAIFQDAELPCPLQIPIRQGESVEPEAVLFLNSSATHDDNLWINSAQLLMQYENAETDFYSKEQDARVFQNNEIISYPRHLLLEQKALNALDKISWRTRALHHTDRHTLPAAQDWVEFMLNDLPLLKDSGWKIITSPHFQYRIAKANNFSAQIEKAQKTDWFDFQLEADIDGDKVQLLPIIMEQFDSINLALSRHGDTDILIKLRDGRQLPIARDLIAKIMGTVLELFEGKEGVDSKYSINKNQMSQLIELETQISIDWRTGLDWRKLVLQLIGQEPIENTAPSLHFTATLRSYQQKGMNWLHLLYKAQLGGILADDMGLGKTVQTLAHLDKVKQEDGFEHPAMVLAPTSLLYNWQNEARMFAPNLNTLVIHGTAREELWATANDYDVIITSYPLIRRDWNQVHERQFSLLILDEAQALKNPAAKTTQMIKQIHANRKVALTGTPMENHLSELWSLFDVVSPGFLGNHRAFQRLYRKPIEQNNDRDRQKALSSRIAPFLLRRRKNEVEMDLPPKTEINNTVTLYDDQQNLYETIRLAMHQKVQLAIQEQGLNKSQLVILDALLKLRQLCCHPNLVKLQSAQTLRHSAKLDILMSMLDEMQEEGRRVLLFSQFTQMLAIISKALTKNGIKHVILTGSTKDRQSIIDEFQSREVPVFLISLKAGGTGLNLTAADTVIHYDPWWNPAVENQATDRAHRIGQSKPVFVYRLICKNSVEEKIQELQKKKRQLYEAILDDAPQSKIAFTMEDIESLFAPLT